jgi:hypothetical protein
MKWWPPSCVKKKKKMSPWAHSFSLSQRLSPLVPQANIPHKACAARHRQIFCCLFSMLTEPPQLYNPGPLRKLNYPRYYWAMYLKENQRDHFQALWFWRSGRFYFIIRQRIHLERRCSSQCLETLRHCLAMCWPSWPVVPCPPPCGPSRHLKNPDSLSNFLENLWLCEK